ncbi:MAG: hypothetical protein B6D64_09555 [Bacteroidetes bacterium 4484_276]|nr:MAG: hypothetical protein B6D64_09555 [Bacteroidetes bacterium 4484_276]OYT13526.1 MAG: hypothetical protein B6I19_04680 [Bacteroidetes bacterium 4572_114]
MDDITLVSKSKEDLKNALKSVGHEVSVKSISGFDDMKGVIVKEKKGGKKHHYPLCTTEPIDYEPENWEIIHAYSGWLFDR